MTIAMFLQIVVFALRFSYYHCPKVFTGKIVLWSIVESVSVTRELFQLLRYESSSTSSSWPKITLDGHRLLVVCAEARIPRPRKQIMDHDGMICSCARPKNLTVLVANYTYKYCMCTNQNLYVYLRNSALIYSVYLQPGLRFQLRRADHWILARNEPVSKISSLM